MLATRFWILFSTWLVATGWILSVFHELNQTGYLICFVLAALPLLFWCQKNCRHFPERCSRAILKLFRRLKRPAPLLFFIVVLLNLVGGIVTRPDNWDTNAYRIPRVLHWLGSDGWHWIHTADSRMNIAGCNFEWMCAPLILFLKTDRWLFFINFISYCLLPGLIFSLLRRLRVNSRVAWWWMWILSFGWCYVQQACSTINDSFAVIYAIAAVALALNAGRTGKIGDLWLSVLSVGLLTGVKQTNLPLVLPWLIAAWPARRLWLKRPAVSGLVIFLGLLVSAATISYLNWKYAGTWSGFPKDSAEQNLGWGQQQQLTSPVWGLLGNLFCLPVQNCLPPFFPWAPAWNAAMDHFLTTPLGGHFAQFESFAHLDRSATQANVGIGLGVVFTALISIWAAHRCCGSASMLAAAPPHNGSGWWLRLLWIAPWLSLIAFMAKVGTYQNARQAAPYYVLLFPLILTAVGHAPLVRRWWWRCLALAVMACTLAHLTFTRGREFLPTATALRLAQEHPKNKFLSVFRDYFASRASLEAQRHFLDKNGLAGEAIVGYATICGASEPALWMPFGSHRVERVLPADGLAQLENENIHYVVVEDLALKAAGQTIGQWAAQYQGHLVGQLAVTRNPGTPPGHLYLVHLPE